MKIAVFQSNDIELDKLFDRDRFIVSPLLALTVETTMHVLLSLIIVPRTVASILRVMRLCSTRFALFSVWASSTARTL